MTNPTRLTVTLAELRELHALPDEALLNVHEAAAFLRLSPNALNWYRSQRRGPTYQRVGPKVIRYRVGDLRACRACGGDERWCAGCVGALGAGQRCGFCRGFFCSAACAAGFAWPGNPGRTSHIFLPQLARS